MLKYWKNINELEMTKTRAVLTEIHVKSSFFDEI